MYFLSIESSTKIFSLAVSNNEKVLRFRNLKANQVLEDSIIPAVNRLLLSAGVPFEKLDAFVVGLGPGSFTSLRIGLSTVKAFAMATGKPIAGIGSLDTIAARLANEDCDEICVISDARRNLVYSALFKKNGQGLERQGDYQLSSLAAVLDRVHGRTLFAGDALALYQKDIEHIYRESCRRKETPCQALFTSEKFWFPEGRQLAKLAYERLCRKNFDDPATLAPVYLYAPDCQVTNHNTPGK